MAKILVLDIKNTGTPQSGIPVARSLKELGHTVYGADETKLVDYDKNIFEDVFHFEEISNLNLIGLLDRLEKLKEVYDIEYIYPCYDETTILLSYIKDKIEFAGIKVLSLDFHQIKSLSKKNLGSIFDNEIFATPKTIETSAAENYQDLAKKLGYPLYVKGLTKNAFKAMDELDLKYYVKNFFPNKKFLLQKEIVGKLVNAMLAYDPSGQLGGYVEMQKIATDMIGSTWFGKIKNTQVYLEKINSVLATLNLKSSIIEVEIIESVIDGKLYVYEVNYRPPSWVHVATKAGTNMLDVILRKSPSPIILAKDEFYFGRKADEFLVEIDKISIQNEGKLYLSKGKIGGMGKLPSDLLF